MKNKVKAMNKRDKFKKTVLYRMPAVCHSFCVAFGLYPIQAEEYCGKHCYLYISICFESRFVLCAMLMSLLFCAAVYFLARMCDIPKKALPVLFSVGILMIAGVVRYNFNRIPEEIETDFASSNPCDSWEAPFKSVSSYNEILLHGEKRREYITDWSVDGQEG